MTGSTEYLRVLRIAGAALLTSALIWLLAVGGAMASNNGTLKIHEAGTPEGTPNNDPKVCLFHVEAFNLDPGQTGVLVFSDQGGDEPSGSAAGPFVFGPADSDGFFASPQEFNLAAGHYKATLFGDGELTDVKAKSKVFKVNCEDGGGGQG